jgi:hypothetical protein
MSISMNKQWFLVACAALMLVAAGCDCGGSGTTRARCTTDADCSSDGSRFCDRNDPPLAEADETGCVLIYKECTNQGQCCPGQTCPATGLCFEDFLKCRDDSTCPVKGQVCRPMGESQDLGCTFERCNTSGTGDVCAAGLSCFNGYCVGEPPCRGGCPTGSVCTPVNDGKGISTSCFKTDDPNTPFPESCSQSCRPGTMLVFEDGYNVFTRCDRRKRECKCEPLPPVSASDLARHSSAAIGPDGSVLVSAYDGDHGDLVLHQFDKATLKLKKTEWIDGIPTDGPVVGDPDGPRGGRTKPGVDVGHYTALAFDPGASVTHIAYYAAKDDKGATLGNLKYASRTGTGTWKVHTVDGQTDAGADTGDAGLYASIALTDKGFPVVAYFQKSGVGADATRTALKVARARIRTPEKAADWTIVTVETGTRSATAPKLAALPEGNGLFPSIVFDNGVKKPAVVWYDNGQHVLKGAVATSDSDSGGTTFTPSAIKVLDDGVMPASSLRHDVGQFPSLTVAPAGSSNHYAIAYFDITARQLRVLKTGTDWKDPTPAQNRIADDGKGPPETDPMLFVGADTHIAYDAAKNLVVVYQDSTGNDLRAAVQVGDAAFKVTTIAQDGAGGFYANLLIDGQERFATHAIIKARSASESANRLELVKIQLQ